MMKAMMMMTTYRISRKQIRSTSGLSPLFSRWNASSHTRVFDRSGVESFFQYLSILH
jgi:hypothetical protein